MPRVIPTGEQSYSKLKENNYFLIDKTLFIKDWWERGDAVTLITRPRRFGKTLIRNTETPLTVTALQKSALLVIYVRIRLTTTKWKCWLSAFSVHLKMTNLLLKVL